MYDENKEINNNKEVSNDGEYFLKVPISILHDKNLNNTEKILLMIISNLSRVNRVCFASNKTLAELHNSSNPTITRCIKSLEDKGYIRSELIRDKKTNLVKNRNIYMTQKGSPKMITRLSKNEMGLSKNDDYNKINHNKINHNKIDDDISKIKNLWNSISDLNKIEYFSPTRENSIEKLINDYGLEKIEQAIELIPKSDYLLGKTKTRTESVSFDWFIKPDNFIKVLEGGYNNHKNNKEKIYHDFETDWEKEKGIRGVDEKRIIHAWNTKNKEMQVLLLNVNTQQRLGELVSQCGIDKVIKAIESKEIDNSKYDETDIFENKPFIKLIYDKDFEESIGYTKPEYDEEWTDEMIENDYLNTKRL